MQAVEETLNQEEEHSSSPSVTAGEPPARAVSSLEGMVSDSEALIGNCRRDESC